MPENDELDPNGTGQAKANGPTPDVFVPRNDLTITQRIHTTRNGILVGGALVLLLAYAAPIAVRLYASQLKDAIKREALAKFAEMLFSGPFTGILAIVAGAVGYFTKDSS